MGYADQYGDIFHRALDSDYPSIPWRTPIPVEAPGVRKFACRYCIAAFGLGADKIAISDFTFDEIGDCRSHLANNHPELSGAARVQ